MRPEDLSICVDDNASYRKTELRTTMDEHHHGPFLHLALLEARRLNDPALHLVALRTFEPEVLARVQALSLQRVRGEACQLIDLRLAEAVQAAQHIHIVRRGERRTREDEAAIRERLNPSGGTAGGELDRVLILRREIRVRGGGLRGRR